MFPLVREGAWLLAASRGWTLDSMNKLHPAPRANGKDFAYFPAGTNPARVPQDSLHRCLDTAAALCLRIQCSVTLINMQDPWHNSLAFPWHQL